VEVSPRESGQSTATEASDTTPVDAATGQHNDTAELLPGTAKSKARSRSLTKTLLEWGVLIAAALVIALLIKTFLFQAFYIPSDSMVPTLEKNDRVIVNKLSYRLHDVNRGDIVVFKAPPGADDEVKDLVKRVVALPGETVEGREGHVWVDGKQLEEGYLPDGTVTNDFPQETVPPDSLWVMGDNRAASKDSRSFKFVPQDDVVGRVFLRIWPLNRIGIL
jgi:signal peptidase I